MEIQFTQSRPQSARLVAQVTDKGKVPVGLDKAMTEGMEAARFKGNTGQVFDGFVDRDGQVFRLAIAGAGDAKDDARLANLEKAGAALTAKYQSIGNDELVLDLSDSNLSGEEAASVLFGLRLRNWRYDIYRTKMKDDQKVTLAKVTVVGAPEGTQAAWEDMAHVATGVEFTRELITEPANILYPETFVERCQQRFEGTGAELIVLDEAQMEKLGMGSLLGVGLGSDRESRILAIRWNGGAGDEAPTALVGKGVTFDSGGISIKPGPGMEDMKWDMGGAGAVAGAMLALVGRKAKANVVGVVGLVENMPDGKAQRPGDIVRSKSGQTVEIINTDAEGRLVLGDLLTYTIERFEPAVTIDLATLTGAIIVALGHSHAGLYATEDATAAQLLQAGMATGDQVWRMPLGKEYDSLIDSKVADMKNTGGRSAGSITAAQFLKRYVGESNWVHIDLAGTAMGGPTNEISRTFGSGWGVRLLDRFIADNYEG